MTTTKAQEAFAEGYKAGYYDAFLGHRSEYNWLTFESENAYTKEYGRGYRAGHHARRDDLPCP